MSTRNARVHSYATQLPTAQPNEFIVIDDVGLGQDDLVLFTELNGCWKYDLTTGQFVSSEPVEAGDNVYITTGTFTGYLFTTNGTTWTQTFIEVAPPAPIVIEHQAPPVQPTSEQQPFVEERRAPV